MMTTTAITPTLLLTISSQLSPSPPLLKLLLLLLLLLFPLSFLLFHLLSQGWCRSGDWCSRVGWYWSGECCLHDSQNRCLCRTTTQLLWKAHQGEEIKGEGEEEEGFKGKDLFWGEGGLGGNREGKGVLS